MIDPRSIQPDPRKPNPTRARRGFTLVEVVISVSLLSLVAMTAYQTMDISTRFHESGTQRLDGLRQQRVDRYRIRRLTDNARPWPQPWSPESGGSQMRWFFEGNSRAVEFVSSVGLLSSEDGWMRKIRLETAPNGGVEVTEWKLSPMVQGAAGGGRIAKIIEFPFELSDPVRKVLASERVEIRFSYRDTTTDKRKTPWSDQWVRLPGRALPKAIRMVGRFGENAYAEGAFEWIFPLPNRAAGWPEDALPGGSAG